MRDETRSRKGLAVGSKAALASLIDYQEGAVVSRSIIEGKTGTITLFAFDQGEGLSEHQAPYDAFIEILEGEASISIEGRGSVLTQGECIILPGSRMHSLKAPKRFKMLLTMLRSQ